MTPRSAEGAMFARVSYVRYPPEHHDAGLRFVREELLPALRQAPGYRGCHFLTDGRPGTGLALVFWESEEAADAASADRRVIAARVKLAVFGLAIESRKIYEVVAHDEYGEEPVGWPSAGRPPP